MKGVLFVDYVRMLRGFKSFDWSTRLPAEDLAYLQARIDPDGWYPMATFERMGNEILRVVAKGDTTAVQMWGRLSVDMLRAAQPMLVERGDPIETLNRFRVLRATYFDFEAIEVLMLHDEQAQIEIRYHMSMPAEAAAAMQTMGFFQRLLEIAGAIDVQAAFRSRSWAGDPRTVLALQWRTARG